MVKYQTNSVFFTKEDFGEMGWRWHRWAVYSPVVEEPWALGVEEDHDDASGDFRAGFHMAELLWDEVHGKTSRAQAAVP